LLLSRLTQQVAEHSFKHRIKHSCDKSTNDSHADHCQAVARRRPAASIRRVIHACQLTDAITDDLGSAAPAIVRRTVRGTKFSDSDRKGKRAPDEASALPMRLRLPLWSTDRVLRLRRLISDFSLLRWATQGGGSRRRRVHLFDESGSRATAGRHPDYRDKDGIGLMLGVRDCRAHRLDSRSSRSRYSGPAILSHDYVSINADYRS